MGTSPSRPLPPSTLDLARAPQVCREAGARETGALAQQFADHFDAACRPYEYALSTRSGAEALAHTWQVLTETSPTAVDGVGAYDHVSRQAMLEALRDVTGACRLLPCVRMWYGSPSTYVWQDSVGQPHRV